MSRVLNMTDCFPNDAPPPKELNLSAIRKLSFLIPPVATPGRLTEDSFHIFSPSCILPLCSYPKSFKIRLWNHLSAYVFSSFINQHFLSLKSTGLNSSFQTTTMLWYLDILPSWCILLWKPTLENNID